MVQYAGVNGQFLKCRMAMLLVMLALFWSLIVDSKLK